MGLWGGEIAPANRGEAVTPSDDTDFTNGACEALYVGGTGDVVVVFEGDTAILFSAVPAGTVLPVRAMRVNATSTTATFMTAMYTRG